MYHFRPWRSWITQQIPILESGGSNPFGRAKIESTLWGVLGFILSSNEGVRTLLVYLVSVRLGGDTRDIKCDGSHSERTRAEHESLRAGQNREHPLGCSRFYSIIKRRGSNPISLSRIKWLKRFCRMLFSTLIYLMLLTTAPPSIIIH